MNDNSWLEWASGVAVILFGWIGKRLHDRDDKLQKDIEKLQKDNVTRQELNVTLRQMREDRERMHKENREDLHYIRGRVDDLIDR